VTRALRSARVRNFKAVRDSGVIKPGGLTVFIGDNGSGKSSVLEALRFAAMLASGGLDHALEPFGGFEHLRWKGGAQKGRAAAGDDFRAYHPLSLELAGTIGQVAVRAETTILERNREEVFFQREILRLGGVEHTRDERGNVTSEGAPLAPLKPARSLLSETSWFDGWQHLDLAPAQMGRPALRRQSSGRVQLAPDGQNVAEYLLDLRERSLDAFEGLLEAMQVVLPYAVDLQPEVSSTFERRVAMRMREGDFRVPGWMFSTGTLRVLCLLALLRHPAPPTVLCVEEVENGLDPRTVHLVVDELLRAVEDDRMQVIVTTHSPYLLDLLPLESIVLVTRAPGEPPEFHRPAEEATVRAWAKRFAPGRLYTTGNLHRKDGDP